MEIILVGLIIALAVSRALRQSKARNPSGYMVSASYRAKTARAHGGR